MKNRYYYDLHCHNSDSIDSPAKMKEIVAVAKKRGLDGIAITNHNKTYSGPLEIDGLQIIPGNEITIDTGAHLLAYFIEGKIKKEPTLKEATDFIKKQGGYAVLAHPTRKEHGSIRDDSNEKIREKLKLVDGLEGGNASDSEEDRNHIKEIKEKNNDIPLFLTAGSDVHMAGQVGFSAVETKERLTKENFSRVLNEAEIIVRPESKNFREQSIFLKGMVYAIGNFLRVYNLKFIRTLFFVFIIRGYFRIKNRSAKKINFSYKN
jgi:predicted metal-dependent phosphoesterase TrpH